MTAMTMGGRGICDLTLSWDQDAYLDIEAAADCYCAACMEKINGMDYDFVQEEIGDKRCPFAMIDFTTGELYSLNGKVTACFIRDYYMNFDFGDKRIDGVVVYAPERVFTTE